MYLGKARHKQSRNNGLYQISIDIVPFIRHGSSRFLNDDEIVGIIIISINLYNQEIPKYSIQIF